jgi:hypothetical protein
MKASPQDAAIVAEAADGQVARVRVVPVPAAPVALAEMIADHAPAEIAVLVDLVDLAMIADREEIVSVENPAASAVPADHRAGATTATVDHVRHRSQSVRSSKWKFCQNH